MHAGPTRKSVGFVITYVADRGVELDRAEPAERHDLPMAVGLLPISGRSPTFGLDHGPAVREPQRGRAVAAVGHELEPFEIADEPTREPDRTGQHAMGRRFAVEAEPLAIVPDRIDAFRQIDEAARRVARRHLPIRI